MAHLLVKHTVKDYATWRPVFDGHAAARKAAGARGARVFRGSENPNEITLLMEWDDPKKARQFFQAPELREVMARGGVIGQPEANFLEEVERTSA